MHQIAPLIYDLAVMLGVAAIVTVIFQKIHQPVVLGYLVAGIIIGPYTPPHALIKDIPNIQLLSQLGVIFLMFSLGLEFSFQKLNRVGVTATVTGILEVILMIIIGYLTGRSIGWSYHDSLFLGAALSISSTTIIIKAIEDLGLKTKKFAELIFGVLIMEDLLAILLLVALSTIVITKDVLSLLMLIAAIKLILVVSSWFIIGYFLVPPIFKKIANYISEETLTIVSIALCLFLVTLAANFHYSTALGAFIMGSILAETILIKRIEILIRPIRDIFAAVFFISVGMLIDPFVIFKEWRIVMLIIAVTIIGKIITTSVSAFLTGQSVKTSVRMGFGMAQIGEFSFIIVALGLSLQVVNNMLYPIIVAVSGVTTFTTPYLIKGSEKVSDVLDKALPESLQHFFSKYSSWIQKSQPISDTGRIVILVLKRLIINGIVIAFIFAFVDQWLFPKIIFLPPDTWPTNTLSLAIALVLSAPFIWGMLFSFRHQVSGKLLNYILFIAWLFTLAEIALLTIIYFHSRVTIFLIAISTVVFFGAFFKTLEKFYHWFEDRLISNISRKKKG